jgi:hypothetical protein
MACDRFHRKRLTDSGLSIPNRNKKDINVLKWSDVAEIIILFKIELCLNIKNGKERKNGWQNGKFRLRKYKSILVYVNMYIVCMYSKYMVNG